MTEDFASTLTSEQAAVWERICNGPNADLYYQLKDLTDEELFTHEEHDNGICPLFFGYCFVDDRIFKRDHQSDDSQKKRIKEILDGEFTLPTNGAELLENIDKVGKRVVKMVEGQSGGCSIMAGVVACCGYTTILESLESIQPKIQYLIKRGIIQ